MLLTPHLLTGVAVATLTKNPILGLFFALLSHYLLDIVPHKEYSIDNIQSGQWSKSIPDFLKVFLDIILGVTIVFLTIGLSPLILAAIFMALFPDGLSLLYHIFPTNNLLIKHKRLHERVNIDYKKIPSVLGIASQIIIIVIAIYLLK